jgi:cytochrome b6-f complex iron-sulfur subunit
VAKSYSRRSFLDLLLGTTVGAWLVTALYPVVRYLKPLQAASPAGPARLDQAERDKLEKAGFVIVPFGTRRVLVFKDDQSELRALDAKCTHEGCTVQYVADESVVWCACHNARFDVDGNVVSGPPPRPLPRFTVQADADGNVLIGQKST